MNKKFNFKKHAKPNYGLDGPPIFIIFLITGILEIISGIILYFYSIPYHIIIGGTCFFGGLGFIVYSGLIIWTSKIGKLRKLNRLLDTILWRGDEQVLDVGCGRGLLLISAAKRLNAGGKAVGVDIWRRRDQSGNSPDIPLANAMVEKVADRVEIKSGDARQLPFDDNSFDIVVSSLVIHNIHKKADRKKALIEIVRVLKPDGHLAILDILHKREYLKVLYENGMNEINCSKREFLYFYSTHIITGRKLNNKKT